ncbi:MAG: YbaK/EbsC family protein [Pseudomonadota bacterium]
MSLESVRRFFTERAPEIEVIETEASSATVELAAAAHGVEPERIAKTICVQAGDGMILVVAAGTARLDNRKFKDRFAAKPKMPGAEAVEAATGHPVGGVCPFGLASPLPVYLDESLRPFDEVIPAAGAPNAAVRLSTARLAKLTSGEWADLCK